MLSCSPYLIGCFGMKWKSSPARCLSLTRAYGVNRPPNCFTPTGRHSQGKFQSALRGAMSGKDISRRLRATFQGYALCLLNFCGNSCLCFEYHWLFYVNVSKVTKDVRGGNKVRMLQDSSQRPGFGLDYLERCACHECRESKGANFLNT